jgi:hypothetical protein
VNLEKIVIFQMYLNYVSVRNVVKIQMLLVPIKHPQIRNFPF